MSAETSAPAARAALILATTSGMRPQLFFPATLMCQISTGIWASRPMRNASSSAAEDRVAFIAHVGGVDAAEFSGLRRERDQFGGLRIRRWRVLQRGGDADCAVLHGVANERFHLIELCRRGLLVVVAEDHPADLGRADIAGEVDAHSLFFEPREIFAKCPPVRSDFVLIEVRTVGLNDGVVERSDGTAFAGNFGGNALIDF